jgi:isoleucyl-tRNA synthetase
MARQRDLDVSDIEMLMDLSKVSFMDGELVKAIGDISVCLEFLRRRYKNSETLNTYLADMLRMAPELEKIGLDDAHIEQSLLTAVKANRSRKFDVAQDLIDQRVMEVEIKDRMRSLGVLISSSMKQRPVLEPKILTSKDSEMVVLTRKAIESMSTKSLQNDMDGAVEEMHRFLFKDLEAYFNASVASRLAQGEVSSSLTMYLIVLALLKVASSFIPFSSESIFQANMKELEGTSSIFLVIWPGIFLDIAPRTGTIPEK